MPLYMIERNFAQGLVLSKEIVEGALPVVVDEGNKWLFSFLSDDKKKMYCLYEAPNPEAILAAAKRLGMPADVIVPVEEIRPEALA